MVEQGLPFQAGDPQDISEKKEGGRSQQLFGGPLAEIIDLDQLHLISLKNSHHRRPLAIPLHNVSIPSQKHAGRFGYSGD